MNQNKSNQMKLNLSINWSDTQWYTHGMREIVVEWNACDSIPREGEQINIPQFIKEDYTVNETFYYEDQQHNVFDWIENTSGWEVESVKWDYQNGTPLLHILVGEK